MVAEPDLRTLQSDMDALLVRMDGERRARQAIEEKLRNTDDELIRCPRCFEERVGQAAMQDHESLHIHDDRIGTTEDRFPKRSKRSSFLGHSHWPATLTREGVVELATAAEIDTGTDSTRAVTPDGLAGSDFGRRYMQVAITDPATDDSTGTKKWIGHIPPGLDLAELDYVHAEVATAGTTGTLTVDINKNGTTMLSTKLTIDSGETGSDTAATAAVISVADIATNDVLSIDVDGIHTTASQGLVVTMGFQLA